MIENVNNVEEIMGKERNAMKYGLYRKECHDNRGLAGTETFSGQPADAVGRPIHDI
jgi:hypothetical protein